VNTQHLISILMASFPSEPGLPSSPMFSITNYFGRNLSR